MSVSNYDYGATPLLTDQTKNITGAESWVTAAYTEINSVIQTSFAPMDGSSAGTATLDVNVTKGVTNEFCVAYVIPSPRLIGTYWYGSDEFATHSIKLNVVTGNSNVTWTYYRIFRISSNLATQRSALTAQIVNQNLTNAGVYTVNAGVGNAWTASGSLSTDWLIIALSFSNAAAHASSLIQIKFDQTLNIDYYYYALWQGILGLNTSAPNRFPRAYVWPTPAASSTTTPETINLYSHLGNAQAPYPLDFTQFTRVTGVTGTLTNVSTVWGTSSAYHDFEDGRTHTTYATRAIP